MSSFLIGIRRLVLPLLRRFNVGDITVRHPFTGRRIRVHSFRHRNYWLRGRWREREEMIAFEHFVGPGMQVLDVGGNIGYLALYFAKLVGDEGAVYVFEPDPANLVYLRNNVQGVKNIEIIESGVGPTEGSPPSTSKT